MRFRHKYKQPLKPHSAGPKKNKKKKKKNHLQAYLALDVRPTNIQAVMMQSYGQGVLQKDLVECPRQCRCYRAMQFDVSSIANALFVSYNGHRRCCESMTL